MPIRLTRFSQAFSLKGRTFRVELEVFLESSRSSLSTDGGVLAIDSVGKDDPDRLRNHRLAWRFPDGSELEVELGPVSSWSYGAAARLDGELVHESHPGKAIGYGPRMQRFAAWAERQNAPETKARNEAAWKRNWPSLAVDVSLGLIFFLVAREFGLVVAAVAGAAAASLLWVVQKATKIDLLGGLAVFGIVMSLISAAFALLIKDESLVQHRGTILGVAGALPFLADGLLARGERLAVRLARYLAFPVDARRLGVAMGLIGLVSAGMNAIAVAWLSQDHWLLFTTFVDTPLVVLMFLAALLWVSRGKDARIH